MIFLTVGSHEPFDRLIRGVDEWAAARGRGDEVFAQITARASYRPQHFDHAESLSPADFAARMQQATQIVSHAGMGTIITALSMHKPIAVLPRRGHLRETRNDHQYATVRHLGDRAGIYVALDDADLPATLDRLVAGDGVVGGEIRPYAEDQLIGALREMIHERA